jgi:hypothetical protein
MICNRLSKLLHICSTGQIPNRNNLLCCRSVPDIFCVADWYLIVLEREIERRNKEVSEKDKENEASKQKNIQRQT